MRATASSTLDRQLVIGNFDEGDRVMVSDESDLLAGATGTITSGGRTAYPKVALDVDHGYFKVGAIYGVKAKYLLPA